MNAGKDRMNAIGFRCDASPEIGSGHIMRCLGVADRLHDMGWSVFFITGPKSLETVPALKNGPYTILDPGDVIPPMDWMVIDHYGLDRKDEGQYRDAAKTILVIDDLANRHHDCDYLLDQTYGRRAVDYTPLVPDDCRLLLGTDYALLRPEFGRTRLHALENRLNFDGLPSRLLVSAGNTNLHNIHGKILEVLQGFDRYPLTISVVMGSKALYMEDVKNTIQTLNAQTPHSATLMLDRPDMARIMAAHDLAIGAGGTTSWERCCLGLPSLVTILADNQITVIENLADAGALFNLGWYNAPDFEQTIRDGFNAISDLPAYKDMAGAAAEICDGKGLDRLITIFDPAPS